MKSINYYIVEKFKISSKNAKQKYLDPEDIEGPETPAEDYQNEPCIIIGKPFKNKQDKNYKETKDLLSNVYSKNPITYGYDDIEEKDMFDWFVFAKQLEYKEIGCFGYGHEGVIGINK